MGLVRWVDFQWFSGSVVQWFSFLGLVSSGSVEDLEGSPEGSPATNLWDWSFDCCFLNGISAGLSANTFLDGIGDHADGSL